MYRTERIFIVSALLLIGLSLTLAVSRGVVGAGAESPMLVWLLSATLIVLAGAGARWLRPDPNPPSEGHTSAMLPDATFPVVPMPLSVIVPGLMAAGFIIFLQLFENGVLQVLILLLAGAAFAAVYWAQAHSSDPRGRYFVLAHSALNVLSHLTAFLLFSAIYGLKLRSLFSATSVGVITALLIYEMLSRDAAWHRALGLPVEGRRTTLALLSLVAGVVAAEITWGLNYWAALTTLVGGAFLLVVFYVIYGLASHHVDQKLTRQTLIEFGAVGMLGIAAIFASAFLELGALP